MRRRLRMAAAVVAVLAVVAVAVVMVAAYRNAAAVRSERVPRVISPTGSELPRYAPPLEREAPPGDLYVPLGTTHPSGT